MEQVKRQIKHKNGSDIFKAMKMKEDLEGDFFENVGKGYKVRTLELPTLMGTCKGKDPAEVLCLRFTGG